MKKSEFETDILMFAWTMQSILFLILLLFYLAAKG